MAAAATAAVRAHTPTRRRDLPHGGGGGKVSASGGGRLPATVVTQAPSGPRVATPVSQPPLRLAAHVDVNSPGGLAVPPTPLTTSTSSLRPERVHTKLHMPARDAATSNMALATAAVSLENALEHRCVQQSMLLTRMRSSAHLSEAASSQQARSKFAAVVHRPAPGIGGCACGARPDADSAEWWRSDPQALGPITEETMHGILRRVCREPQTPLPATLVGRILHDAFDLLLKSRHQPVTPIQIPGQAGLEQTRLVILGDTHGQLEDLLWIFHEYGLPSQTNLYLVNGDIADRGRHALEIYVLLFGFMIACPNSVFVNRGNHEDEIINSSGSCGGFTKECLEKYVAPFGGSVYEQVKRIFAVLPLAATVEGLLFVVHGGISRHTNFFQLLQNCRDRRPSVPFGSVNPLDQAMAEALWNDPSETPGFTPSGRGDHIFCFGPDVTDRFLRQTGFACVIRSHEVPPNLAGVHSMHGGRLLTVFSASNYCGVTGNTGGVLTVNVGLGGRLRVEGHIHFAPTFASGAFFGLFDFHRASGGRSTRLEPRDLDFHLASGPEATAARQAAAVQVDEAEGQLTHNVLIQVAHLVVENKQLLWSFFFGNDPHNTGYVPEQIWLDGCNSLLGELCWEQLQSTLVGKSASGDVNYTAFLHRFRVLQVDSEMSSQWGEVLLASVYQKIIASDLPLTQLMRSFDRDNSGTVTIPELQEALAALEVGITSAQAASLMRTLSAHASTECAHPAGGVDIDSFLSRFELSHHRTEQAPISQALADAINKLGRYIWTHDAERSLQPGTPMDSSSRARQFFQVADKDRSGLLSYTEFRAAMRELIEDSWSYLHLEVSEAQMSELFQMIDVNASGMVSYMEFLAGFAPRDMMIGRQFHLDVMEHICTTIFRNKAALLSACKMFDMKHTGEVSKAQLKLALRGMNVAHDADNQPLTEEQISVIIDHTKFDERKGKVDYNAFLDSFQVAYLRKSA